MSQQTNFDILKFILGSEAWGNKTKEITLRSSIELFISFVLFHQASEPSMNFNISKLVFWARNFYLLLNIHFFLQLHKRMKLKVMMVENSGVFVEIENMGKSFWWFLNLYIVYSFILLDWLCTFLKQRTGCCDFCLPTYVIFCYLSGSWFSVILKARHASFGIMGRAWRYPRKKDSKWKSQTPLLFATIVIEQT